MRVLFGWSVKGAGNNFTLDRAAHVRDFFRALINQQDHQHNFWVIALNRCCDLFHNRGLTGLWRRHDNAALSFTDRRDEVNDASGHVAWIKWAFKLQLFIREQRRQVLEAGTVLSFFWISTIDGEHLKQRRIFLIASSGASHTRDMIAFTQTVLSSLLD